MAEHHTLPPVQRKKMRMPTAEWAGFGQWGGGADETAGNLAASFEVQWTIMPSLGEYRRDTLSFT
jgi:hypothetical protein